jgi:nitrate reductase gamma subunit
MTLESAETYFWIVHLPMMVLFCAGMWIVVAGWVKAGSARRTGSSAGHRTTSPRRSGAKASLVRSAWLVLKGFAVEAWFNRRLLRNGFWRWLTHFMLLSGFMLTMGLSGISALSDKLLIHVFQLEHIEWIAMWVNQDHPVTAVLNEFGALLMTVGLLFFVVRRYLFRIPQLRTGPLDTWMVVGLGLILLSGWATELVRLNSSHVGPITCYAFVSHPLAPLLSSLQLDWDSVYAWMYLVHGLLTSVVIVTIPFSKFMHVIAGALVTVARQVQEEAANARA